MKKKAKPEKAGKKPRADKTENPPSVPAPLPVLEEERFKRIRDLFGGRLAYFCLEYLKDSLAHMEVLQNRSGDHPRDARIIAAHSLKGSSSNLGALRLAAVAGKIEKALIREEPLPRPELETLEQEFHKVDSVIRRETECE